MNYTVKQLKEILINTSIDHDDLRQCKKMFREMRIRGLITSEVYNEFSSDTRSWYIEGDCVYDSEVNLIFQYFPGVEYVA